MVHKVKYNKLTQMLKSMGSVAVAFSGGVDSSLLTYIANKTLKDKAKAFTFKTPYIANWEFDEAREFCNMYNIPLEIVELPMSNTLSNNPEKRCYLCKNILFSTLKEISRKQGFNQVVDGTNSDDRNDFRPGMIALKELSIRSPFLEAGITKSEIRELSQHFGLPTWDKPAYACLLTRIPHDTNVKTSDLRRIESAEKYLIDSGFRAVRVRSHNELARIEVSPENISLLIDSPKSGEIIRKLKELGFKYVTVDMEGYRTGSLNPEKNKKSMR